MKSLFLILVLMIFGFASDELEIKSLKIGMTKKEVSKIYDIGTGRGTNKNTYYPDNKTGNKKITIAGKDAFVSLEFRGDKLDYISFSFDSIYFGDVFSIIKDKYQYIKCEDSIVRNKLGASFNQKECFMEDSKSSILYMQRLGAANIDRSHITIRSANKVEEQNKKYADSKKDI